MRGVSGAGVQERLCRERYSSSETRGLKPIHTEMFQSAGSAGASVEWPQCAENRAALWLSGRSWKRGDALGDRNQYRNCGVSMKAVIISKPAGQHPSFWSTIAQWDPQHSPGHVGILAPALPRSWFASMLLFCFDLTGDNIPLSRKRKVGRKGVAQKQPDLSD